MAESAANFAFTSEGKPSVFEVIAQHSLNVTLHPALQRIAEFLSESSPNRLGWLYAYYEETFLVLNGLLQYHYTKNYDASFSEYFYGLRRVSAGGGPISARQRGLSLLLLALLPYLKRKLERRLSRHKDAEGRPGAGRRLLAAAEVGWGAWVLANYLRYMADATPYHRPALWLLGVRLALADDGDEDVSPFWGALVKGRLSAAEAGAGLLRHGLRTSLEVGAFFVQFLGTWYAERPSHGVTALPSVPPPDGRRRDGGGRRPLGQVRRVARARRVRQAGRVGAAGRQVRRERRVRDGGPQARAAAGAAAGRRAPEARRAPHAPARRQPERAAVRAAAGGRPRRARRRAPPLRRLPRREPADGRAARPHGALPRARRAALGAPPRPPAAAARVAHRLARRDRALVPGVLLRRPVHALTWPRLPSVPFCVVRRPRDKRRQSGRTLVFLKLVSK